MAKAYKEKQSREEYELRRNEAFLDFSNAEKNNECRSEHGLIVFFLRHKVGKPFHP